MSPFIIFFTRGFPKQVWILFCFSKAKFLGCFYRQCCYRQTTNGSYWHCLLLQGKNQSNFGIQLSQGNHIHNSKFLVMYKSIRPKYNLAKVWFSKLFQLIWTFDVELITFHLSIILSQISLVKLANSFQLLCVHKTNLPPC